MVDEWTTKGVSDDLAGAVAGIILGPGTDAAPWIAKWKARPKEFIREPYRTLVERDDISGRLREIKAPAIVFHGEADVAIPDGEGDAAPRGDGCLRGARAHRRRRPRGERQSSGRGQRPARGVHAPARELSPPGTGGSDDVTGPRPLAGVVVLDLSRVLSGPSCGKALVDLGADVIKVEPPEGDLTRTAQPRVGGLPVYFAQQNCGKRCVSVDLGIDAGREIVAALAAAADVVLENFRPGVLDRLGSRLRRGAGPQPERSCTARSPATGKTGRWRAGGRTRR